MDELQAPETLEGWCLLHQMFRIRFDRLAAHTREEREAMAARAAEALASMRQGENGTTALSTLLGHKGDLMLIHARRDFAGLQQAQLDVARLALAAHLEPTTSYVSIVELGMYEMTAQIHGRLLERGLKPGGVEYADALEVEMEGQRRRVIGRLYLDIPQRRYVCFYPMNKRRGEAKNWYAVPFAERARMMLDHGKIGRKYAGEVNQIISGSIGYDDWEWGVDLFADEPVVFKKLVYEMRFDEASAWYGEFGPFYTGLQFAAEELPKLLAGEVPLPIG
jgi:chlorite dismutase